MCATKTERGPVPKFIKGIIGVAINGVPFRPNTAGFWDPNGRRGHSRHGNRNWSVEIFGAPGKLGLDFNNGHVGRAGMYHYHGIAISLTKTSGSSLVGYARDGFEIHPLQLKKIGLAAKERHPAQAEVRQVSMMDRIMKIMNI